MIDVELYLRSYYIFFILERWFFSMKNNKNSYPIPALREELRLRASALAVKLSRSVGRLTSCENAPCLARLCSSCRSL